MQCLSPFRVEKKSGLIVYAPCGQCIACRLNYGKLWSIRMMEELKNHDKACFATLTYDGEHYEDLIDEQGIGRLCKKDLQNFWKRLRKERKVRYFACGEYGDRFGRPHYHAIIYGVSPEEVDLVQKHWPNGYVRLGTVTEDSCAYVAKYMTKKLRGKSLESKLSIDPNFQNEFVLMSRRPGIGAELSPAMVRYLQDNGIYYRKGVKTGLPRYWKEKFNIEVSRGKKHLINEVNASKIIERRLKFFKRKG